MLPASTERRFPPPTKTQARSSGRTTSRGTGGGTPTTTVERLTASQGPREGQGQRCLCSRRTSGRRSLAAAGKPTPGPPTLSGLSLLLPAAQTLHRAGGPTARHPRTTNSRGWRARAGDTAAMSPHPSDSQPSTVASVPAQAPAQLPNRP